MSATDFTEDITNGDGFTSTDELMAGNGNGTAMEEGGSGDQAAAAVPEAMDSSSAGGLDTGSADQYGKDDDRKLFIGGLSWETTEKDLRDYFTKYGGIESLTLKTDPTTGRSRGFAFIVFNDGQTLDKVVAAGEHLINGKKVDPKKAKARHGKIFVGGLSQEISDEDIKTYFAQFGNVVEIEMPIDKTKNQRKGFCFVTFDNEQVVHELLKNPKQVIGGKEVDVKKAQPSQNSRGGVMGWGGMGIPGLRGRGGVPRVRGAGRGGRGDWSGWAGAGYGTGYPSYGGGYGDYYGGGGYGSAYAYDGYGGYGGYGGYESSGGGGGYGGYEAYDSSSSAGSNAGTRGSSRGRGFGGKQRGAPRGQQRHVPY